MTNVRIDEMSKHTQLYSMLYIHYTEKTAKFQSKNANDLLNLLNEAELISFCQYTPPENPNLSGFKLVMQLLEDNNLKFGLLHWEFVDNLVGKIFKLPVNVLLEHKKDLPTNVLKVAEGNLWMSLEVLKHFLFLPDEVILGQQFNGEIAVNNKKIESSSGSLVRPLRKYASELIKYPDIIKRLCFLGENLPIFNDAEFRSFYEVSSAKSAGYYLLHLLFLTNQIKLLIDKQISLNDPLNLSNQVKDICGNYLQEAPTVCKLALVEYVKRISQGKCDLTNDIVENKSSIADLRERQQDEMALAKHMLGLTKEPTGLEHKLTQLYNIFQLAVSSWLLDMHNKEAIKLILQVAKEYLYANEEEFKHSKELASKVAQLAWLEKDLNQTKTQPKNDEEVKSLIDKLWTKLKEFRDNFGPIYQEMEHSAREKEKLKKENTELKLRIQSLEKTTSDMQTRMQALEKKLEKLEGLDTEENKQKKSSRLY